MCQSLEKSEGRNLSCKVMNGTWSLGEIEKGKWRKHNIVDQTRDHKTNVGIRGNGKIPCVAHRLGPVQDRPGYLQTSSGWSSSDASLQEPGIDGTVRWERVAHRPWMLSPWSAAWFRFAFWDQPRSWICSLAFRSLGRTCYQDLREPWYPLASDWSGSWSPPTLCIRRRSILSSILQLVARSNARRNVHQNMMRELFFRRPDLFLPPSPFFWLIYQCKKW